MKKLNILFYILALSVLQHDTVLAQMSSIHTINGNKAVFQITTDKSFTLNFVDTPEVHEIMIHLVYNSDSETHKLWMIKNVKTTDSTRIDTVDKFTLHDPVIYQELKNTLNKIAQNKFGIQRPVSDASISAIYLWLHHIRHFDDKAPLSGELILNEYIMVISNKSIQEQYKDYYNRSGLVQKKANEYSAAIAKLESYKQKVRELSLKLIHAMEADTNKISSLLRDKSRYDTIKSLGEKESQLKEELDRVTQKRNTVLDTADELRKQLNNGSITFIEFNRLDSQNRVEYYKVDTSYNRLYNDVNNLSEKINIIQRTIDELPKYVEALAYLDKYISQLKELRYTDVLKEFGDFRYKINAIDSVNFFREYYTNQLRRDASDSKKQRELDFREYWNSKRQSTPEAVDSILVSKHSNLLKDTILTSVQRALYLHAKYFVSQIKQNYADWLRSDGNIQNLEKDSKASLVGLTNDNIYKIEKVSLQFERGFLERIQVWVTFNDRQEIFENIYAIGFSSVNNFKTFKDVQLFARNSSVAHPYIFLSDVIANYDNLLQNYTRDYCPADTAINNANPSGNDKILKLRNERLVNLFDSKIYTDLRGIAENQPNGLVQVEVNKRFNLNTERHPLGSTRSNYGRFNFLNLWGALTKIENKDKLLSLRNDRVIQNNVILSPSYATTLDFLRYEMLSLGGELNLLLFDLPDSKFTIYADFGTRYGFTKVRDSVYEITNNVPVWDSGRFNEREAHTVTLFPRIKAEIFAEKRVGFTFSYQYNYTYLFSNNYFKQVASYAKSQTSSLLLDTRARGSHMMEMYVRIQASEDNDNKFFVRARLFLQRGDVNTSFSQLQLGYSYNLFYKK